MRKEMPGEKIFTLRAVLTGLVLSFVIGAGDVYNLMVVKGSYMSLDFTTPAAIFFIFWLTLYNYFARKFLPRFSFSFSELILIYIMMIVACSIPTMGLTLYLIPLISGTRYYANISNKWEELFISRMQKWLLLQDNKAISWFFEGIPQGQSIPWASWIKPLSAWVPLILAVYAVMILLMVVMRKQWSEREKLNYPLTRAPMQLIYSAENNLFKNGIFWAGFIIPVIFGCINALHFYFPLFPHVGLGKGIPIFRRTMSLIFLVSFPMIGFSYFVSLPLSFSLWFFSLFSTLQQGIFNMTGFGITEFIPYTEESPVIGWAAFGTLIVIVLYGFWKSRRYLADVCRKAVGKKTGLSDEEEIVSYRTSFFGIIFALVFIFLWLVASGLPPIASAIFIFFAFVIFIGITRVITEGGLAATRAPVIAPVATTSLLGSNALGVSGLASLGMSFVYTSDVRTFVMASVANGLKMLEDIKKRKRIVFWAILLSILVALFSSIWATIILGYKYGAVNAESWFFISGPQYPWRYIAEQIKNPQGTRWLYLSFAGAGVLFAIFLQAMRMRFLWFPFHPLGFAFSTLYMTKNLWFSIFIAWLIKTMLLRYGGAKVHEKGKNFFVGLIVGQFVLNGVVLIIDCFTGRSGNVLFWA